MHKVCDLLKYIIKREVMNSVKEPRTFLAAISTTKHLFLPGKFIFSVIINLFFGHGKFVLTHSIQRR